MESEILIIGAGIFGVSTAYHLSLTHPDPSRVTILDVAPHPAPRAASTDMNKIIRADYTSRFYMELAYEAMDVWEKLPIFTEAGVFHRTGWVLFDSKGDGKGASIRKRFRASSRADPTVDFTVEGAQTKWNGVLSQTSLEELEPAYANPAAGWADADDALKLLLDEAIRRKVRYEVGEVHRLILGENGISGVWTTDGTVYTAHKYLLATGAWTSQLMSPLEDELGLPDIERVESQLTAYACCVAHLRLSPDEAKLYEQLPVVVFGNRGELLPVKSNLLKLNCSRVYNVVTTETGHKVSFPLNHDQSIIPEATKQESLSLIKSWLPQLLENGRQVDTWRLCWDSLSPDNNMLITQHPNPKVSNLYFAAAGSAHSFKFLPVIGKYVVNVLDGTGNGEEGDHRWSWKAPEERTSPAGCAQPS
ncbi:hypothetical protein AJ80_06611 [Polytolypa hystricis UAMH7299]|uniref:FAD dependent oxidoreductase domain-containing protein n=1 Tax=Polytolypa hystricis (strain UAMH7299) TaxID=1447883 RepID=A0A2B7XWA8_POLH7|nr:hypothetical protein AJ80_06611 [Polytolypa hystricis UAMH7299]